LQETEDKQIVLATYAMAAEALDIKTLSVLVMASPKTDITQSVGRILRVRHDNPIVVDIVDRHDTFQNQWRQRKTFYRKCNYRILSMDSVRYQGMSLDWKTDKTWSKVFEPRGTMKKEEVDKSQRKCLISIKDLDIDNDA
jgi:superfamily II DNA or RNA helicase